MPIPATCLDAGGRPLPFDAPDMSALADVDRCECCGKPVDRDEEAIAVDARDFASWMASLWWKDPRLAGLVFARLMCPRSPLQELACLLGCSKPTATRLWQRLHSVSPPLANFVRGAERRGGDRRSGVNG